MVEPDQLLHHAVALAQKIARHSHPVVAKAKECVNMAEQIGLSAGLSYERWGLSASWYIMTDRPTSLPSASSSDCLRVRDAAQHVSLDASQYGFIAVWVVASPAGSLCTCMRQRSHACAYTRACLLNAVTICRREFWSCFALQDQKEGMAAFTQKRKPEFKHC